MFIVTRQRNAQLYTMMRQRFSGYGDACLALPKYNRVKGAIDYLHRICEFPGWIVNCDEDCFVTKRDYIADLIGYMDAYQYDYCGMPDGGVQYHRSNSWANMNPFFNIFNMDVIRPVYQQWARRDIDQFQYVPAPTPPGLTFPYAHNYNEPFASFFYWLHAHFRPLYLQASTHRDGISTILHSPLGDVPLVYHAWYSRYYPKDAVHTPRIDALYAEVCLTP